MKRSHRLLLALLVIAAGAASVLLLPSDEPAPDTDQFEPNAELVADGAYRPTENQGSPQQNLASADSELTSAEKQVELDKAVQKHLVIPKSSGKSTENCAEIKTTDAEITCWDHYNFHPYFGYSDATLKALADSDAAAAQILGFKLLTTNAAAARTRYLQAATLSGKAGPLVEYLAIDVPRVASGQLAELSHAQWHYAIALLVDFIGFPYSYTDDSRYFLSKYADDRAIEVATQLGDELIRRFRAGQNSGR